MKVKKFRYKKNVISPTNLFSCILHSKTISCVFIFLMTCETKILKDLSLSFVNFLIPLCLFLFFRRRSLTSSAEKWWFLSIMVGESLKINIFSLLIICDELKSAKNLFLLWCKFWVDSENQIDQELAVCGFIGEERPSCGSLTNVLKWKFL